LVLARGEKLSTLITITTEDSRVSTGGIAYAMKVATFAGFQQPAQILQRALPDGRLGNGRAHARIGEMSDQIVSYSQL